MVRSTSSSFYPPPPGKVIAPVGVFSKGQRYVAVSSASTRGDRKGLNIGSARVQNSSLGVVAQVIG